MTNKQIVEKFLDLINCKEGLISTLTGEVITYKELHDAILDCLNQALEDGYNRGSMEANANASYYMTMGRT